MNTHALKVLGYAQLKEYLAKYTDSEITQQKVYSMQPSDNYKLLLNQSLELAEYRYLLTSGQNVPLFTAPKTFLLESFKSALIKGWRLSPEKIAATGELLLQVEAAKNGFIELENISLIKERISKLVVLPELTRMIVKSVSSEGEILDKASADLARIRRVMKKHQERIRSKMEELAMLYYKKGVLQDPIVTMRQGRYVLPVRAGAVRELPGIVHDKSSSGATFFIEPNVSVNDSNALSKLEADERHEVQRILLKLTEAIGIKADILKENLEIIVEMDFIRAKARFSEEIDASFIPLKSTPHIDLKSCKNPLLVLHRLHSPNPEERLKPVIPIDIQLDSDERMLVITGPNTGGKTVALKTIGISLLMIQSGLHPVCSDCSSFGIFNNIFADIGDEQSLEQNLSTFSSHISQIIDILEKADSYSLALLDELGAGTDPEEGSALGIAILKDLLRKQVYTIVNTHHNSIKAFAFTTPGIKNAAMEFDSHSLQPTYRILMGKIGQSNALSIAAKLGLPKNVLKDVENILTDKTNNLQRMLDIVEQRRQNAEKKIAQADSEKARARELRKAREDVLQKAQNEAKAVLEKAIHQSQSLLSELHLGYEEIKKEIKRLKKTSKPAKVDSHSSSDPIELKKHLEKLGDAVTTLKEMLYGQIHAENAIQALKPGDFVLLKRFNKRVKLMEMEGDDRLIVELNGKKIRVSLKDIVCMQSDGSEDLEKPQIPIDVHIEFSEPEMPPLRLNLIGKTRENALDELERYMDQVIRSGLPQVTIIHGFGTGTLQNAVVKFLKKTPQVVRARSGEPVEGGGGVTVVELKAR